MKLKRSFSSINSIFLLLTRGCIIGCFGEIVSVVLYSHCNNAVHSSVPDPAELYRAALESDSTCDGAAVMSSVVREPPRARQSCCSDVLRAVIEDAGESHTTLAVLHSYGSHAPGTAHSQRAFRSSPTGEALKLTSARSSLVNSIQDSCSFYSRSRL